MSNLSRIFVLCVMVIAIGTGLNAQEKGGEDLAAKAFAPIAQDLGQRAREAKRFVFPNS